MDDPIVNDFEGGRSISQGVVRRCSLVLSYRPHLRAAFERNRNFAPGLYSQRSERVSPLPKVHAVPMLDQMANPRQTPS